MDKTIITVVGKDTVGIIAKVCTYLASHQINVLDISQTIVQDFFNMRKEAMIKMMMMEGVTSPRVATAAPRTAAGTPPTLPPVT